MRISYIPAIATGPIPSLEGGLVRLRPIVAVRVTGPSDSWLRDALLDTGADDTVFEEGVAQIIGVDLTNAEERQLGLVGRPESIRCRYAPVELSITDGRNETYRWTTVVGFVASRLRYPLLGQAGFFRFFNASFRVADGEVTVTANRLYPGVREYSRRKRKQGD